MKLLKSICEKAWLFDAHLKDNFLQAGLACFLPGCSSQVSFSIQDETVKIIAPAKVVNSPVPARIANARLPLLS